MIEKNLNLELLYIYVDVNISHHIRRIIVEYSNKLDETSIPIFEFYKTLEIKGPSFLKNGNKIGHNNRIITIWIETNSIICGDLL